MTNFRRAEEISRAERDELDLLRQTLYAGGKIRRQQADVLVDLRRRVRQVTPAFEQFFYHAIKDHLLASDRIDAEQAAWLRQVLVADGRIIGDGRAFLLQLRGEAKQVSPEFEEFTK